MKYKLYDLKVTTKGNPKSFNCSHVVNEGFLVQGENIKFLSGTEKFSHYVLASLIPYIAAKQRASDVQDWMFFESLIACPDPNCGAKFEISRLEKQNYEYTPAKQVNE